MLFVFKSFACIVADECGSPRDSVDSGLTDLTDDTVAEVNVLRFRCRKIISLGIMCVRTCVLLKFMLPCIEDV